MDKKNIDLEFHKHQQEIFKKDREKVSVEEKYQSLEQKYKNLWDYAKSLEETLDFVQELDLSSVKSFPIKPKEKSGTGEATAILQASDWHIFEVVDPRTISYLNAFNYDIMKDRIKNLFRAFLTRLNIEREGTHIRQMIFYMLGDLMTNTLHADQEETNTGTETEEALFLLRALISGIDFLLEHSELEHILAICHSGNHGRTTEKPRVATRERHSYEWMVYNMLSDWYKNEPRIDFIIADGYHVYQEVYSEVYRSHHGDWVNYRGGVGGLTVPMNKATKEWDSGRKADKDFFGHFHTYLNTEKLISNGSLIGYNNYAVRIKAPFQYPSQNFVLADKKRGITTVSKLFVEKARSAEDYRKLVDKYSHVWQENSEKLAGFGI